MSKLHFANLSFDEKSFDTLRENEKYLRLFFLNIYFFTQIKSQDPKLPLDNFFFFKVILDRAMQSQTRCTVTEIRICVSAGPSSGLESGRALFVEVTSVRVHPPATLFS